MKYDMTKPCKLCPFRKDAGRLYVSPLRLREFASQAFPCHQTAELNEDDDEDSGYEATSDSQHCAGSLIFHEKMGQPNQMMRIAERLGIYDPSKIIAVKDRNTSVFGSWTEVERQTEKEWEKICARDKKRRTK